MLSVEKELFTLEALASSFPCIINTVLLRILRPKSDFAYIDKVKKLSISFLQIGKSFPLSPQRFLLHNVMVQIQRPCCPEDLVESFRQALQVHADQLEGVKEAWVPLSPDRVEIK